MLTDWSETMDMLHTCDQNLYTIWQITSPELLLLFFKHFLRQWIFPTQFWNLYFLSRLHCKQILYHWANRKSLFNSSKNCKLLCWTPGFPGGSDTKESARNAGDLCSIPEFGRSPREGHVNPLEYSCLENLHGQKSLAGYSPWDHKESDTTEWLSSGVYLKLKITNQL